MIGTERKRLEADRLEWLLDHAGEAAHSALNEVMISGSSTFTEIVMAAHLCGAEARLVLAIHGYLPGGRSGGRPFFHVKDWRALGETVYLQSHAHTAAYQIFVDAMWAKKSNFSLYPAIVGLGPDGPLP